MQLYNPGEASHVIITESNVSKINNIQFSLGLGQEWIYGNLRFSTRVSTKAWQVPFPVLFSDTVPFMGDKDLPFRCVHEHIRALHI